jgi:LEA14-like dessication related protein
MVRNLLTLFMTLALSACATMSAREPVQVTVAGIESLPGEGLEARMLVKLRVQNPNDTPIEYDGVYVKVDIYDRTFGTGVSDERGVVPRFGEAIVAVPLSVSALRMVLGTLEVIGGRQPVQQVTYRLEGKLNGAGFGSTRFNHTGQLALPGTGEAKP